MTVQSQLNVDKARKDTPGCSQVLHFNNAGAALMPQPVAEAMINHLHLETSIGGYEAERQAAPQLEHTYQAVARLLNCSPEEVAIVENATRAWDMAFYALPLKQGDIILTCQAEYASNYIAYLHRQKQTGITIIPIPNDETGELDIAALETAINNRVKLIAVTHVPTNGGLVNPAERIGRVAKAHGIPYLLDACQSVGQMPVDVDAIGCDMLSATARKFLRGPRGIGFLYVRKSMLEQLDPPFLDLHAATWTGVDQYEVRPDARRFENWESNIAGKVALGVACDYALSWGLDVIQARVRALATLLRARLKELPGVSIHDLGRSPCGIVSFTVSGRDPQAVMAALEKQLINVSTSPMAYTRLDMESRGLERIIRASVHYYNTETEVDRFCTALNGLLH